MLTIQFKDFKLCEAFYNQLLLSMNTYGGVKKAVYIEEVEDYTNLCIDLITIDGEENARRHCVASVLTNVTIKNILPVWIEEWLRESFHYSDPFEIEAIQGYARDLFFYPKTMIPLKTTFVSWQNEMFELYYQLIRNTIQFSYDSFLKFRLREQKEQLVEVVEKAIDEYKMEHDYQEMLNTCRDYIKSNPARIHTIHLYLDQEVKMVDQQGETISINQIRSWLSKELNFEAPLPINERVIGPLVCMAPEKLIVYPLNTQQGLLQTLLLIFEERMEIKEGETEIAYSSYV
ncbi:putative sporulation protein YtxC [Evansella tamaricis]|uniref:Sporulation protein YtxC n=1 Tax=Evansella tamaricis TaxID=2069301 RepID=A0ABS6JP49_9BACI|nr:putative sporulation protein YtxC [Evansella tamaricis]MBU9714170.1 putative sporulation protein YtxC [Evansella tamaricis]